MNANEIDVLLFDELNAAALADVLRDADVRLTETAVRQVALAGHRLRPCNGWPSTAWNPIRAGR